MAKRQVTLKGRGPELFGRGVDLLFGDADEGQSSQKKSPSSQQAIHEPSSAAFQEEAPALAALSAEADSAWEEAEFAATGLRQLTSNGRSREEPSAGDEDAYLKAAAQDFMSQSAVPDRQASPRVPPADSEELANQPWPPLEFDLPPLPGREDVPSPELAQGLPQAEAFAPTDGSGEVETGRTDLPRVGEPAAAGPEESSPVAGGATASQTPGVLPAGESLQPSALPSSGQAARPDASTPGQPLQPGDSSDSPEAAQQGEEAAPRAVGAPGVRVSGPVSDASLSGGVFSPSDGRLDPTIINYEGQALTDAERRAILRRLKDLDPDYLIKMDREVERLYKKVTEVMSGEEEAQTALAALRKARLVVLLEPERFAEAEYLIQQIRAALNRIEVSLEAGKHYGPRLLAYNIIWLAIFGVLALLTTVPGNFFFGWAAYLLSVPENSDALGYAMMLMSTLAWGGIGGVTGALWSLHYHISVARDYDPAENMWYLEQPLLGMVLGGIVYLIMASGFLVVQADLSSSTAALGARLLPAAVAVVVGFRQTVVLDLIERIVRLLAPPAETKGP